MTEEDIIRGCLKGDPICQRRLYERFASKMMGVCLRYCKNQDDASDVLQDAFVKVFEKLNTYQGQGSFEGWMRRIFVNTALDAIRRDKNNRLNLDIDDQDIPLISPMDISSEMNAAELLAILQKIPAGYQVVFNLYAIEGYSHKEIAEQLGISENTSKSQYSRARGYLLNVLSKQGMI